MDEQMKSEEKPQEGQQRFEIPDEEIEIALKKLLAGWDW